jgi:DNA polymerase I-like protein with 3'-5' exonuclease and polymerase domains
MKWLLYRYNINVKNYSFDPMIAHYIAVSEERGGHGLKDLAWEHTDMGGYDNALDDYKKANNIVGNYDLIEWEILREYAAADVDCTMRLIKVFEPMINAEDKPKWPALFDLYMEGSYALRDMEVDGIKADEDRIQEFQKAYLSRIAEIEEKLRRFPEVVNIEREKHKLFELRALEMKKPKDDRDPAILKYNKYKNFEFSFGSTVQLRELLFEKLGLETPFLTDKGKLKKKNQLTIQDWSTGKETLAYLEDKHPIANLLSEWRKLEKLYGTYIAPAKEWIGEDGLVHPSFNLTGTVTSRLSSEAPNAQNFPRKSNNPKEFQYHYGPKKLFVSRFGADGVIVQFDYSQLELRVAAIFSNDPGLMGAYRAGKDLHIYVASKVYKVSEEEVTDDQRTAAKAVGFGLLYGKGARSLAADMNVSLEEAEEFIATYFKEFAGMKEWIDNTKKQVRDDKYVETLAGFWRRLPGVDSNDRGIQSDAFRQAINSPIQGSGASMTLKSIILINMMFKMKKLKSVLAITVHDSIVADVHVSELKVVYTIMKQVMENLPFSWITVPIVSDAEIGRDYGTLVGINDIEEVISEGVFEYIDRKVYEKKKKDYEKAGMELITV